VHLASRFVRSVHDAEDAVQSALMLAEQRREQLRDGDKRWAWLCRIVIQQCQLTHRQRQSRHAHERAAGRERHTVAEARSAPHVAAEFDAMLETLVHQLPPQQRTALVLRHFEEMSFADIAAVMEVAESTARVHVRAAREGLRTAIVKRYPEWMPGG
jgi:RNA polymerase sigma factor (sigma-70 family)